MVNEDGGQDSETYAKSKTIIFPNVSQDHAYFSNGARIKYTLVDFEDAQYSELKECLGDEVAKKVLRDAVFIGNHQ